MSRIRVYWELTGIMALITVGLVLSKSYLLRWGLFLPLSVLTDCILAYTLISIYVEWRSHSEKHKGEKP